MRLVLLIVSLWARAPLQRSFWIGAMITANELSAAEGVQLAFDIPAGAAEKTLQTFATQARVQFIFSADKVRGTQTRAIKGKFTSEEALRRMLLGTSLKAIRDDKTGALTVDHVPAAVQQEGEKEKTSRLSPKNK